MLSTHVHNWSHTEALLRIQIVGDEFDLTWPISEGEKLVGQLDGAAVNETFEADPYVEEIAGFIAAVAANDPTRLRSPYPDACQTLAVCVAATQALTIGESQDVERI